MTDNASLPKLTWTSALVLLLCFFAIPPALIAAFPATLLYLAVHRNQASGRASFWATYLALFWAALGYVAISMVMSWVLYLKAVWFQGYTMSLQPAWLLNYYNPRLFGDYHTIMTALHLVSIAGAAILLRQGIRKRVSPYFRYREALGWSVVLLPLLVFAVYSCMYVLRHLCPAQTQAMIDFVLIR